ncbi:MAG: HAD family phosphatase [Solirubrobacterales bacterium]
MPFPTAALFDNDGLLLDTESVWSRAEQSLFESRDRSFTIEHKRALVGSSEKIAGRKLASFLDEPGREREIMEELNGLVLTELEGGVDPMVGAVELVGLLQDACVPVGLVSNSPRRFIERSHEVAATGIRFDVVVSAHEVPEAKPAPDAYLEACHQLGIDPGRDVVALEDSPGGVAAAAAAGLFVIGVPSVPGVGLEADLVASSLEDDAVLERIGITPSHRRP